jgi:beta-lactamase superfamily II metal-dependent hydrolase
MRFALEALQARDGDCLMLHYAATGGSTVRVLFDGGPKTVYKGALRPLLDQLRGRAPLDLRLVVVTHIDADHITGILDLFRDLKQTQDEGVEPFCRIQTLWHNAFQQLHGAAPSSVDGVVAASLEGRSVAGLDQVAAAVVASIPQGNQLRQCATQLAIPINQGVQDLVLAPDTGLRTLSIADGLTFTILAPHKPELDRLAAEWQRAKADHPADSAAQTADYLNNTVPNMSSIVLLAQAGRSGQAPLRMLLTGDARGDVILDALDAAGLSSAGRSHFDLLKVQHHGSSHSTTQDFFERVTADRYVISGNGKHGNPHPDALRWLSAARHGQPFEAYLTNRSGDNDLEAMFDTFLAEEARNEPGHVYRFRNEPDLSITVELADGAT